MTNKGEQMNITEFLEARITEDETRATYYGPLAMGTARVLAECAAKRAIIVYSPPKTLQHLAAVYKDHPDYQQEWALEA